MQNAKCKMQKNTAGSEPVRVGNLHFAFCISTKHQNVRLTLRSSA
jgi:hypothetical protein